ncbi:tyrosine-type recombinase/integrase [Bacteroides sp. AN502(2024)]|uniref:tyrosine-type recombinase/integrase n=1 Tax=Bacteroides sp. AN502(2024) TaxID=3160599 RepID=UPI003510F021
MKEKDLFCFMNTVIRQLEDEGRYGTAHVYRSTLNRIREFEGGRTFFPFQSLTRMWLKALENYLYRQGKSFNTISTYMRMLRAMYNRAAAQHFIPFDPLLFRRMHTGSRPGCSRALSTDTIHSILNPQKELPGDLEAVRRCFVLLFLLRGLCFVDLAYMRPTDLQSNRIFYCRRKTGRPLCIDVEPEASDILREYISRETDSPYLFPFVRAQGKASYRQYQSALRLFNKQLKRLSAFLGLEVKLSSYCARHSWATIANFRHYDKSMISNAMGHSSVKVTETYFQRYNDEEIARMNREIILYVSETGKKRSGKMYGKLLTSREI